MVDEIDKDLMIKYVELLRKQWHGEPLTTAEQLLLMHISFKLAKAA